MNDARDADIAVVYYAGHGIEVGGTNYLIPVDAKLATDFDAEDEAVSLERVILALQPARQLRLIILDACRENPFLSKIRRTVSLRGLSPGLGKIDPAGTDTLIAYSAKAGSVSFDGNGPNSPFTTALLKYIAEPGIDIRIALGRVRDEVLRTTNNEQEPFVYGSLGGAMISLVPTVEPKKSEPQQSLIDTAAAVQRDYELAERVGTRQAWESFLVIHSTGFYADLARAQLAKQIATPTDTAERDKPGKEAAAKALAEKALAEKEKALAEKEKAAKGQASKPPEVHAPPPGVDEARLTKAPIDQKSLDSTRTPPPVADVEPVDTCTREAEQLRRLRASPNPEEIKRFAAGLTCKDLRPQVARLLESIGPTQSEPAKVVTLPNEGPARKADEPAKASPPPEAPPVLVDQKPQADIDGKRDESGCRRETEQLVKLRANPVRADIERFARDLHCQALRAQISRLLESIGD